MYRHKYFKLRYTIQRINILLYLVELEYKDFTHWPCSCYIRLTLVSYFRLIINVFNARAEMQSATYLNKHVCQQNWNIVKNISHTQLSSHSSHYGN